MREVTQIYLQGPSRQDGHTDDGVPGDCWRTSLASLLGLEPQEVPHFALYLSWWWETRRWLQSRGLDLMFAPREDVDFALQALPRETPVILSGPSPRGSFYHCCVGLIDGTLLWDPHPSRAGLVDVKEFFVLTQPYGFMEERLALT